MSDEDLPQKEGSDPDVPAAGGAAESEEIAHAVNVLADAQDSDGGSVPPMGTAEAVRETNWFTNYFYNAGNPHDADEWFGFESRASDADMLGSYEGGFSVFSGVHINEAIEDTGDTVWGRFKERMETVLEAASDPSKGSENYNGSVLARVVADLEDFRAFAEARYQELSELFETLKPGNEQFEGAGAEALARYVHTVSLEFKNLADYIEPAELAVEKARNAISNNFIEPASTAVDTWTKDPDHAPRRLIRTWWEEQREHVTREDGVIKIRGMRTDEKDTWLTFEQEIKDRWWEGLADVRTAASDGISDVHTTYTSSSSDILPFRPVPTSSEPPPGGGGDGSGDGGGDRSMEDIFDDYLNGGDDDGSGGGGPDGGDDSGGRSVEDIVDDYLNGLGAESGGGDLSGSSGGDPGAGGPDGPPSSSGEQYSNALPDPSGSGGDLSSSEGGGAAGGEVPPPPGGGSLGGPGGGDLSSSSDGSSSSGGGSPDGGTGGPVPPPMVPGMGGPGASGSGSVHSGRRDQNGAPLMGPRGEDADRSSPGEVPGGIETPSDNTSGRDGSIPPPPSPVATGSGDLGGQGGLDLSSSAGDGFTGDPGREGSELPVPGSGDLGGQGGLDLSSSAGDGFTGDPGREGSELPVPGSGDLGGQGGLDLSSSAGTGTPGPDGTEGVSGLGTGGERPSIGGGGSVLTPPPAPSAGDGTGASGTGELTARPDSGSAGGTGGADGSRAPGPNGTVPSAGFGGGTAPDGPGGAPTGQQADPAQAGGGAGTPMMPPMMPPGAGAGAGGGGGGGAQERSRTTWLAEDQKVWGTAARGGPSSLGRPVPGRDKGVSGVGHVSASPDGGVSPRAPFDTTAPGGGKRKPGVGYRRSLVQGSDGQRDGERERGDR